MAAPPGLHGAVLGNPVSNLVAVHLLPGERRCAATAATLGSVLATAAISDAAIDGSMPPSPSPLPPASQPPTQSP